MFPYYVTGAITASGGSWNASIVAEVASWGNVHLEAKGIGAYIASATEAGDFHRIVLGIVMMSVFVVRSTGSFWRPLYWYAERKFRSDDDTDHETTMAPLLEVRSQSARRYRKPDGGELLVLDDINLRSKKARSSACSGARAPASRRCCG